MADHPWKLTPVSFRDHPINDGTVYKAYLPADSFAVENAPDYGVVESQRPEGTPLHVRQQPNGRVFVLKIEMKTDTLDAFNTLKQWMSPGEADEAYLVAARQDGVNLRIPCVVGALKMESQRLFTATMRSASGLWEAVSLTEDTEAVVINGQTWEIPALGTAPSYLKLMFSPNSQMNHDNSFIHRRRVWIANRSPFEVGDPIGDGYPIDLASDNFDTATLTTAKMQTSGNDLRVVLAGEEIYRWLDGMDTSTTKVWSNLRFQPAKTFTLLAAMSSGSSPAAGAEFEVSNPEGITGWPEDAFAFVENEVLQLHKVDSFTWEVVRRGVGGTTAASHAASTTGYWIEHPFLDVIYDYTAAPDPAPPDDRKPRIDLALSLNTEHHWTAGFINSNDRRSRAWQRRFTPDNDVARFIRCYESGGTLIFDDAQPTPGKARFNNIEIDCPIPQAASSNAMELDRTIPIAMAQRIYLTDQEGNESLLDAAICQPFAPTAETNKQFTPGAAAYKVRLNAKHSIVVGVRETNGSFLTSSTLNADGWWEGQVFNLDGNTQVDAVAAQVSGLGATEYAAVILANDGGIPDEDTTVPEKATYYLKKNYFNPSGGQGASQAYVVFVLPEDVQVPQGAIIVGVGYDDDQDDTFTVYRTTYRNYARGSRRRKEATGSGWFYDAARSTCILLLSSVTEPQSDAPVKSGDQLVIDNIELNYDSSYTPKIAFPAEEDMYLHDFTLRNNTTGDWLHVFLPVRIGAESVYIDCEQRTIIDMESGLAVAFAAVASGPDWLPLAPGVANELQYDEVGVTSVDIDWSTQARWL